MENNLVNAFPPEIGYLEDLTNILFENQRRMTGGLPSTIGKPPNLFDVSFLFMGPGFGGVIPPSLLTNPSLKYLYFRYNEGAWRFPSPTSIGEIPKNNSMLGMGVYSNNGFLEEDETDFSRTIPSYISEYSNLFSLELAGCAFEGPIPETFGMLSNLIFLLLQDNELSGTLPRSFGQMASLTTVVLGNNKFEGTLPSSLGNITTLQLLDLSYNQFEGGIPTTFSQLSNLRHISLQHNHLNGSIAAFEPLEKMSSLLLYANDFSSTIPSGLFSSFVGRINADFGRNSFTGTLPETLTKYAANTSESNLGHLDFCTSSSIST